MFETAVSDVLEMIKPRLLRDAWTCIKSSCMVMLVLISEMTFVEVLAMVPPK